MGTVQYRRIVVDDADVEGLSPQDDRWTTFEIKPIRGVATYIDILLKESLEICRVLKNTRYRLVIAGHVPQSGWVVYEVSPDMNNPGSLGDLRFVADFVRRAMLAAAERRVLVGA